MSAQSSRMDQPNAVMTGPAGHPVQRLLGFQTRASRAEYWRTFLAMVLITTALQVAYIAVYGFPTEIALSSHDEVSRVGAEGAASFTLLFNGSIFLFCLVALPVTARRFKDCGWRGGWFKMAWYLNFLIVAVAGVGVLSATNGQTEQFALWFFPGIVVAAVSYLSVVFCVWIGLIGPDRDSNSYGPNPIGVML